MGDDVEVQQRLKKKQSSFKGGAMLYGWLNQPYYIATLPYFNNSNCGNMAEWQYNKVGLTNRTALHRLCHCSAVSSTFAALLRHLRPIDSVILCFACSDLEMYCDPRILLCGVPYGFCPGFLRAQNPHSQDTVSFSKKRT